MHCRKCVVKHVCETPPDLEPQILRARAGAASSIPTVRLLLLLGEKGQMFSQGDSSDCLGALDTMAAVLCAMTAPHSVQLKLGL